MDTFSDDEFLGHVVRYLIEGNETDAANVLLTCSLELVEFQEDPEPSNWHLRHAYIRGPRVAYKILQDTESDIYKAISEAIYACYPGAVDIFVYLELTPLDQNWRDDLTAAARGKHITNQSADGKFAKSWASLQFGSESEVRIAKVLDEKNIMFFPNCKGRLQIGSDNRGNLKPDFLVCYRGKWGILEVDGEPFHPASRTVQDHDRDRQFLQSGVGLVQHFDARACYETPHKVVETFLRLLANS